MSGFEYDPQAVQTALNELNAARVELERAEVQVRRLNNVQRPGDSPSTKAFHHQLLSSISHTQHSHATGLAEITQAIDGLKAVQRQYAAGEEVTWQGFKNKDA
ncbi:MAG: hypothetical protein ACRDRN_06945 [Sciscionella sp.]